MKNNFKKTLACISAVAMLSSAVCAPMSVLAGEQLGNTSFEENIGLPWHICESGTGRLDFNFKDEKYNIEIINPGGASHGGEDRWDCQFRHRGLHIEEGHTYTLSYEITSDAAGMYYSKIGNLDVSDEGGYSAGEAWHNNGEVTIESSLGGTTTKTVEYGQGWNLNPIKAGETLKVTAKWTATGTLKSAEWVFQFGGDGQYTPEDCFPEGTKLTFDNMSIIDETSDEFDYQHPDPYAYKDISVNQLGYLTDLKKQATYAPSNGETGRHREPVSASGTVPFEIRKDGTSVYKGTSKPAAEDADSGNYTYVLDFSDFETEGTGYTITVDGHESYPFSIGRGSDIYEGLLEDLLNYFYLNRSGIDIETEYVVANKYDEQVKSANNSAVKGQALTKSKLAREAGHPEDVAYIQPEWIYRYSANGKDVVKTITQDVTGGWYDAGDYGKYVLNGGISAWTLMNIYERALANDTQDRYKDGSMSVPESSNGAPDLLDEVKYEMDFFLKMIVESGEKKGMVYHKMLDSTWTGLAVSPVEDENTAAVYRIIKPPTTPATLNVAATAAQFARLYKDYDAVYAEKCLAAAKEAYEAAKKFDYETAPIDGNSNGYSNYDTYFMDEFYWAACELYITTGDQSYLSDMKKSVHYLECPTQVTGGENSGDTGSFNWENTQGLGTISLAVNAGRMPEDIRTTVFRNIEMTADHYLDLEQSQGYGDPFKQSPMKVGSAVDGTAHEINGYTWGSNSFIVNNAVVLALAYNITGESKYASGASTAVDYIFGRNPNEISYVTGYGTHHTTFVHHRYWSGQLDADQYPVAPSGVLSGGPNSALQDPYVQGAGYVAGQAAPQLCYLDHIEAWSTNECDVSWNAPLAWMADFLDDYSDCITLSQDMPVITTTTWQTAATTPAVTTTTPSPVTTPQLETTTLEATAQPEVTTLKPDNLYGDVDLNGVVELTDLTTLSQYLLNDIKDLSDQAMINSDVTADNGVNLADLMHLKQYIGKEKVILGPQPK
ncbi:MAG: glycoside hydrolase family 9 protein [Oscillospiraceae bacterium]|nr:glycoside hydrolase family 9 protein [Oscillospiraceae bacterium]